MLIYYPTVDGSLREDIEETFQVSKPLAILLDLHISSCGLVALPISFQSDDPDSFKNYKFLMAERRKRAKAEALKLFRLISKAEVDSVDLPEFDPIQVALKKGKLSIRTKGRESAVVADVTDKTNKLSFFREIHRSTTNKDSPQARDPKSGSPKVFFRLFGEGRIMQKQDFPHFTLTSVLLENADEFERILNEDRFYKSLTWNRIDAFLADRPPELFTWPDLENCHFTELREISSAQFNELGLFQVIDYHVGEFALPKNRRRAPLKDYIERGLRGVTGSDYWKENDQIERLRKLAYKMATQIRMANGKQNTDLSKAIKHWTEDMEWLRQKYYLPLQNPFFEWPKKQ